MTDRSPVATSPRGFAAAAFRYWVVALGAALLATVGFRWVAPWGIRLVHGGKIPLVGRLIPGRGSVSVETYLDLWSALAGPVAFVVTVVLLLGFLAFTLLWHTKPASADPRDAPAEAGDPSLASTLRYALWFALLSGLGEGTYLIAKYLLFREFPANLPEVSEHAIWMTSLNHLLVATMVWALLWVGRGRFLTLRRPAVLAFVFPMLGWLSWLGTGGRIAPWAALLLSCGVASQWVRRQPLQAPALGRMISRTLPIGFGLAILLGGALPGYRVWSEWNTLRSLPAAPAGAPNVILLVLDTQRALNMGLYGYDRNTTPHVDALAAESVVFDRAFAAAPWTLPSHATLFTGRWPHELGVGFLDPLDDTYPTLSELFAAEGYRTGGFAANLAFVTRIFGLARGFHHFDNLGVYPSAILKQSWVTRWPWLQIRKRLGLSGYVLATPATRVNRWFLDWQGRDQRRPFFAFLNYMEAHEPYAPPAEFRGRFGPSEGLTWLKHGDQSENYTAEELQQLVDRYDEDVATADQAFGELFEQLEARGLLENTLLIVTADHGDEFGEHGWMDHIQTVYRTTAQVPLIIRSPDGSHAGERVPSPVSLRDVPSTILEMAGAPVTVPGRPLTRFFGPSGLDPAADSDLILTELGQTRALVGGGYRYMWLATGGEALFDVWNDRYERTDLREQAPDARARLLARLQGLFADIGPDGEPLPDP